MSSLWPANEEDAGDVVLWSELNPLLPKEIPSQNKKGILLKNNTVYTSGAIILALLLGAGLFLVTNNINSNDNQVSSAASIYSNEDVSVNQYIKPTFSPTREPPKGGTERPTPGSSVNPPKGVTQQSDSTTVVVSTDNALIDKSNKSGGTESDSSANVDNSNSENVVDSKKIVEDTKTANESSDTTTNESIDKTLDDKPHKSDNELTESESDSSVNIPSTTENSQNSDTQQVDESLITVPSSPTEDTPYPTLKPSMIPITIPTATNIPKSKSSLPTIYDPLAPTRKPSPDPDNTQGEQTNGGKETGVAKSTRSSAPTIYDPLAPSRRPSPGPKVDTPTTATTGSNSVTESSSATESNSVTGSNSVAGTDNTAVDSITTVSDETTSNQQDVNTVNATIDSTSNTASSTTSNTSEELFSEIVFESSPTNFEIVPTVSVVSSDSELPPTRKPAPNPVASKGPQNKPTYAPVTNKPTDVDEVEDITPHHVVLGDDSTATTNTIITDITTDSTSKTDSSTDSTSTTDRTGSTDSTTDSTDTIDNVSTTDTTDVIEETENIVEVVANADTTDLTSSIGLSVLHVTNEYGKYNRGTLMPYTFLEDSFLIEPYKETTIELNDVTADCYYDYVITNVKDDIIALSGTSFDGQLGVTLTSVGQYQLAVSEGCSDRKFKQLFWVKYVRRELSDLSENDREDFLDAFHTLWTVSTVEGKKIYGERYKSVYYFATLHNDGGGNAACDEFHGDVGFLSNHMYLSAYLEQSLQLVNPKVALHYMEYSKYFESEGFQERKYVTNCYLAL